MFDIDCLDDDFNAFDIENEDVIPFERISQTNLMSSACEDDYESSSPFIDILPEENDEEESPISFGHERSRDWEWDVGNMDKE